MAKGDRGLLTVLSPIVETPLRFIRHTYLSYCFCMFLFKKKDLRGYSYLSEGKPYLIFSHLKLFFLKFAHHKSLNLPCETTHRPACENAKLPNRSATSRPRRSIVDLFIFSPRCRQAGLDSEETPKKGRAEKDNMPRDPIMVMEP